MAFAMAQHRPRLRTDRSRGGRTARRPAIRGYSWQRRGDGGGRGNSQGGTAGSVPSGRSGAGGVGGPLEANAGAAGLDGSSAGTGGLPPRGAITEASFWAVVGYETGAGPRSLALGDLDANG